jgi:hypothetical protein
MVQRFCIMAQEVGSSQVQVIFMPPVHFSIFMVHRGTIIMLGVICAVGADVGIELPMPDIPRAERSIIIVAVMILTPLKTAKNAAQPIARLFGTFLWNRGRMLLS